VGQPIELADRVLLRDAGEVLVVAERLVQLPLAALSDPIGHIVRRLDDLVELFEREFHITANGNVGWLVFIEFRGVDIDMDDFAVLAEFLDLAGDPVVEPHAQRDQQVGLVHGIVCIHRAMHAEHVH
jgi:hypothetical protein